MSTPSVRARDVTKTYPARPPVHALRGVSLEVQPGERLAVVGPSGSGKSTLLNMLGALDVPTSGTVELDGIDVSNLSESGRDQTRAHRIGFVFQESHVLGHRTVHENLALKLAVAGLPRGARSRRADRALESVGLGHRRDALGRLLSGGEKQRLAIARAVVNDPVVLLADEPTGHLDPANSTHVLDLFDVQAAAGVAVVVITHDPRIADWADTVVTLRDGLATPGRDAA